MIKQATDITIYNIRISTNYRDILFCKLKVDLLFNKFSFADDYNLYDVIMTQFYLHSVSLSSFWGLKGVHV